MSIEAPRTIAIVAGYAPSLVTFRGPLIRTLVARGHRVIAIAPAEPQWHERIRDLGASFEPVAFARAGIDPLGDLRAGRSIAAILEREAVDTLLAYTIKPVAYGLPAAARAGVRTRVALITGLGYAFGSSWRQRLVGAVARRLYRRALRLATAVRFQNPDDRDLFIELGLVDPARVGVVAGSGVDTRHYAAAPPPANGRVRFLMIARLLLDKGVREFVDAARALRSRRDDCDFDLVGPHDPNPLAVPDAILARWRDEGVVTAHPATDDVRPYLAACDVFVLPSYREGTPRTVLEAMSTGRPIVTTDAPGCRETTVHGENGYLVPVRDVEALTSAMEALADDRDLRVRMGERSRDIAVSKYDVASVNRDMLEALGLRP